MQPMDRVQRNIVARTERRFLNWVCAHMPAAVSSDHLTLLSVAAAFLVPLGFLGSRWSSGFLVLAAAGFVLNWLGDSLDGSLARWRNLTRPRYGYFLDHSVDAFATILMLGGMGLSPHVHMSVSLFVVVGYLALCIHVFLKNHVTGTFQLSFIFLGPTELRMFFVALTLFMLAFGVTHWVGATELTDCDLVLLIAGSVFMILFMRDTVTTIFRLRALEGDGRAPGGKSRPAGETGGPMTGKGIGGVERTAQA